jgi:predicted Zn-dependent protease
MGWGQDSASPPQTPPAQDTGAAPKQKSKISKTLGRAIPDCISIIFSTCKDRSGRNEAAAEVQEEQLARAAKRCEELQKNRPPALTVSRPTSDQPARPEIPNAESSSRSSTPEVSPYCTPQDVLAAEHDVEVGDFNFKDKNYRGAEMRYRSALERLPGEPIATLHLARVLEKEGKTEEAYGQYKSYMTWSPTGKDAEEAQAAIQRLEQKTTRK